MSLLFELSASRPSSARNKFAIPDMCLYKEGDSPSFEHLLLRRISEMKFALILLLGLLVFSNQQFFQLLEKERLLWWLFHYPPRPVFHNYNYQPVKNHDTEDSRAATYIDRWSHSPGIPAYSQDKQPYLNAMENVNNVNEDQFPDVQSRGKLGKGRFLPSFFQRLKAQYNHPRIVISKASRTNLLKKMKTVTFTLVSTLTIVTVQSCIPISEFTSGWAGAICRKRRGFLESSDSKSETSQFAIAPSGVQPVEQTVLSSPRDPTAAENGPFVNDPAVNHGVISSKDEDILDDFSNVTLKAVVYLREKRFFSHLVTTTTSISYALLNLTVTKTVNLLNPNPFFPPIGQLACLPQGFVVCSNFSTTPPPIPSFP
ncbi:uncharacterized protein LOC116920962 [Daphnia magna]|uniref:uncharacterized protein LOC116920962 n=1 Tax=Daphnia magna TaxID=35525 RepID=UPI001E1BD7CB|nr:uncharacterized protein LOC116920962 [Daphnia magna]